MDELTQQKTFMEKLSVDQEKVTGGGGALGGAGFSPSGSNSPLV